MDYLIRFVQAHETFRRPEIEALSKLADVHAETVSYSEDSPFSVVRFPGAKDPETTATHFISRSILSRAIFELWGTGPDYEALHEDVRKRSGRLWEQYLEVSFKFSLDAYCGKRTATEQRSIIDSFRYLGFEGKIDLVHPDVEFVIFEEWELPDPSEQREREREPAEAKGNETAPVRKPRRIYLGRKVALSIRYLTEKHDLKKRPYISTTSMDAELALVTANLALAGSGKVFFDPFVGTGGFLVAAAELGAIVLGSDIDGRSFRGKGKGLEKGVGRNFQLYGLQDMFGDCIISDLTNTPLRLPSYEKAVVSVDDDIQNFSLKPSSSSRWLDGIICDPPYGIREGLKVLGTRTDPNNSQDPSSPFMISGVPAYTLPGYVAPKKPYSFVRMLDDILAFAARALVDGARLAFWMPTANDEEEIGIPQHACLELVHCCIQPFNKWSRRLLVYKRKPMLEYEEPQTSQEHAAQNGNSANELNPFRRKYFQGFETRANDN